MQACANAGFIEALLKLFTMGGADDVKMMHRAGPVGLVGDDHPG